MKKSNFKRTDRNMKAKGMSYITIVHLIQYKYPLSIATH